MSDNTERRKLAAIMFTDMVGYSVLSQRDDKLALELLEEHRELLREIFPRFHGTEIKTIGDAFLVEFNSALEAAQCAIEIQRALGHRNHDVSAERCIELKIGIHIGDVVHRGGDVYGDGVNIASRIEPLAGAGGICVSIDVERQIRNAVETRLEKLAPTELKNISVPMELFRIVLPWERQKSEVTGQRSEVGRTRVSSARSTWIWATAVVVALAVGGFVAFELVHSRSHLEGGAASTSSGQAPATTPAQGLAGARPSIPEKSIAVLPFENLSDDKSNAYFAEGIQDEILTKLASIADLKVISRTSTAKYRSKPEDLKTVSQQLGVATVLEGTVQRAGDEVRINVQLIDARADSHLWAKSYDRQARDIFAVESEVSQEVADALQAKLSPNEANTLAAAPTKDPQAYDLFLRAEYEERDAESSLKAEPFDRAASFYKQALDRDPDFALATARLAESRILRHWFVARLIPSDPALTEIKSLADRALALAPNLAEAHIALGCFYYYVKLQYENALKEFGRALELQPNSNSAAQLSAYIYRRQGRWKSSLAQLAKCEERDPQDALLAGNVASSFAALRMWPEAKRASSRALAIDPHNLLGIRIGVYCCLNGLGDLNEARRLVGTGLRVTNFVTLNISATESYLDILAGDFVAARQACAPESSNPDDDRSRQVALAVVHFLANDVGKARNEIEKTHALVEARVHERPDDNFTLIQSAWVNLALGHNAEALRLATRAAELSPIEKDALATPAVLDALAQIQAGAGDQAGAVKTLQRLLAIPAGIDVSIAQLKINPAWDPIRNDPGFQQLLKGTELIGPPK
jgi:TolB-like protein/class 3 adenylate cyclase/Flp pilus assembly protein TadD